MVKYSFRNYLEYMRDNPEGFWFKRKLYGWGWVPVRWEGWLVTLGFLVLILWDGFWLAGLGDEVSGLDLGVFFGGLVVVVAGLIGICFWKGERPRWSWGR